ncbi:MAG: hypothetical protein JO128_25050 [Alphaproteobacteria bacterium]|nr:hypothetical protein [Alphaproteobacteria bacterium]
MTRSGLISAAQFRAARALLAWTQSELARRAGSIRMTVVRFERGHMVRASTRRQFRDAFERAGLRFMPLDVEGGEGVIRPDPAHAQPSARPFAFDREFYLGQAQLIAWLARKPANRDIRVGLLSLAREYQGYAGAAGA